MKNVLVNYIIKALNLIIKLKISLFAYIMILSKIHQRGIAMKILYYYLIIINILTFLFFATDKYKAKKNLWRIPESTLLLLSFIGGSLGGILAMSLFHHKTAKTKFKILMPVFLVINTIVLYYITSSIYL